MGSRKLYAVRESDMKDSKKRSTANVINISLSDSEDDLLTPLIRRKHTAEAAKLTIMSNDIKQVKESVSKIFKLTNNMTIPLGVCKGSSMILSSAVSVSRHQWYPQ